MSFSGNLRLIGEGGEQPAPEPGPEPKVFARTLSAPPGMPWDQARSADLEARHGAPLPLSDVLYRLKRLEMWRPGAPARFAAFYVLAREVHGSLEAEVDVDGRPVRVTFLAARERLAQSRRLATIGLAAGLTAALMLTAVGSALLRRSADAGALQTADLHAAEKLRQLRATKRLEAEARAIDRWPNRGAPLGQVVSDLAWAASAKAPDARIDAVHWRGGLMALEVRGETPPFAPTPDHIIERSHKPLRPGVWIWGVAPRTPAAGNADAGGEP